MRPELLVPSVQHERQTDRSTEIVASKRQQRLAGRLKQQSPQRTTVAFAGENQSIEFVRQRKGVRGF